MKNKSDVSVIFPQFKAIVEKYFNLPIVALYSDNGGEFVKLEPFLSINGISHYTTPPHTPELNATAERRHRHIVETARALIHHANLPSTFWSFSFRVVVYLINRLPTPNLRMDTPYNILHHKDHNLLHLHSFGCLCFPWLRPYTSNKLQPRSSLCIFVGYSPSQYSYQCLDPTTNKIYTSRYVIFYENHFTYTTLIKPPTTTITQEPIVQQQQPPHLLLPIQKPIVDGPHNEPPITPQIEIIQEALMHSESSPCNGHSTSPSLHDNNYAPNLVPANNSTRPMITRSKRNIFKPKHVFNVSNHPLLENLEPSNVRQAMKHAHWRRAISEEFDAFIRNGTQSLVPPPRDTNIVDFKWLFRIKRNPDGSISRYKSRLVAKGFTQCPDVDFKETFASVVRPQTIKSILTIALGNRWPMHQLDVNNTFLQGSLQEQVFMEQPPGMKDPQHPNYVCKLHKAIYGLRQAPRA